eukprot:359964_1
MKTLAMSAIILALYLSSAICATDPSSDEAQLPISVCVKANNGRGPDYDPETEMMAGRYKYISRCDDVKNNGRVCLIDCKFSFGRNGSFAKKSFPFGESEPDNVEVYTRPIVVTCIDGKFVRMDDERCTRTCLIDNEFKQSTQIAKGACNEFSFDTHMNISNTHRTKSFRVFFDETICPLQSVNDGYVMCSHGVWVKADADLPLKPVQRYVELSPVEDLIAKIPRSTTLVSVRNDQLKPLKMTVQNAYGLIDLQLQTDKSIVGMQPRELREYSLDQSYPPQTSADGEVSFPLTNEISLDTPLFLVASYLDDKEEKSVIAYEFTLRRDSDFELALLASGSFRQINPGQQFGKDMPVPAVIRKYLGYTSVSDIIWPFSAQLTRVKLPPNNSNIAFRLDSFVDGFTYWLLVSQNGTTPDWTVEKFMCNYRLKGKPVANDPLKLEFIAPKYTVRDGYYYVEASNGKGFSQVDPIHEPVKVGHVDKVTNVFDQQDFSGSDVDEQDHPGSDVDDHPSSGLFVWTILLILVLGLITLAFLYWNGFFEAGASSHAGSV